MIELLWVQVYIRDWSLIAAILMLRYLVMEVQRNGIDAALNIKEANNNVGIEISKGWSNQQFSNHLFLRRI